MKPRIGKLKQILNRIRVIKQKDGRKSKGKDKE